MLPKGRATQEDKISAVRGETAMHSCVSDVNNMRSEKMRFFGNLTVFSLHGEPEFLSQVSRSVVPLTSGKMRLQLN